MKKSAKKRSAKLILKLRFWNTYANDAYELESMLARKPRRLQIDLVGWGEMPPDSALLLQSILRAKSSRTHIVTNARSSLQNGAVLIWLLGDTRLIRADAKLHLRAAGPFENEKTPTVWQSQASKDSDDLEEDDHIRVLEAINAFLPVRELAPEPIDQATLQQFGLVNNAEVDDFLAAAFRSEGPRERAKPAKPGVATKSKPDRAE